MIALLWEGLRAILLPASLLLILPGMAALLAAQERLMVTATFYVIGVVVTAWLRFAGFTGQWPLVAVAAALVVAALVLALPRVDQGGFVSRLGGLLAGGAAAILWQPLVGRELGILVVDLRHQGLGGGVGLAAYLLALLAPVALFGFLLHLVPRSWREDRWRPLAAIGGGTLLILALFAATGINDEVATRLVQWSL